MIEIKIPSVGESVTSASIQTWHVASGDVVKKDQLLVTLETDKVAQDLLADAAGAVSIQKEAGEEVEVGAVIGTIDESVASAGDAPKTDEAPLAPQPTPEPENLPAAEEKAAPSPSAPKTTEAPAAKPAVSEPPAPTPTPVSAAPVAKPAPEGRETRKKMSPLRKKIATHLVNAQHTAAILTTFNECDMTEIMRLRKELQEAFVKQHGIKLGFMSFFVKAVVEALKAVPQINARIEGGDLIEHHYYDVSVAIGTDRGLVVPVLRDCDSKSFAEIEQDILNYAAKAKDGKLTLDDLQGGVFTISNGGVYGSLLSTPILNPPQSGILGMHSIKDRPMAVNGQVVIRPMMYLALSYDHRIVDGKEAVLFLTKVKDGIENPARLLLGV